MSTYLYIAAVLYRIDDKNLYLNYGRKNYCGF